MDNAMPSLADIKAAVGDGGGMDWTWLIALLIIGGIFNGGGFLGGGNSASTQEILFGQQFQNIDNKIDRIGNGIADATFALNNSITGVGITAMDAKADLGSKIDSCCCTTQRNIDGVNYNIANASAAIQANDTANIQKILDALCQNKTEALQQKVNQLELQAALANVPRNPIPAYFAQSPYSYYNGTTF